MRVCDFQQPRTSSLLRREIDWWELAVKAASGDEGRANDFGIGWQDGDIRLVVLTHTPTLSLIGRRGHSLKPALWVGELAGVADVVDLIDLAAHECDEESTE